MPDGDALPSERTSETVQQVRELRDELTTVIGRRLGQTDDEYQDMIDERMRTMTRAERTVHELEMTQRRQPLHSIDYDPLPYNYSGYDPLPVDVGPLGEDGWGRALPRLAARAARNRGWYDGK
jgi:hypothetical protein